MYCWADIFCRYKQSMGFSPQYLCCTVCFIHVVSYSTHSFESCFFYSPRNKLSFFNGCKTISFLGVSHNLFHLSSYCEHLVSFQLCYSTPYCSDYGFKKKSLSRILGVGFWTGVSFLPRLPASWIKLSFLSNQHLSLKCVDFWVADCQTWAW